MLCTHENSDVFNTLNEINLVFTSKKVNIPYIFPLKHTISENNVALDQLASLEAN